MAPKPVIGVQVRELAEFALRAGDLGGDRDFVGRGRALAGTLGHQRLQRSRPAGYQKEVRLSYELETEEFILLVQGRLDGVLIGGPEVLLEEIKTVKAGWDGLADPLHWGQLKVYGFIYTRTQGLDRITLRLTYFNLDTGKESEFVSHSSHLELSEFFDSTAAVYVEWMRERQEWCRERDATIEALAFPFPRYRAGQRELAVAVYRAIAHERRLFLEAPTGIGKTVSVLFPSLKALGQGKIERIFYLTARGTGRAAAEKAFADLRQGGLRLKTLTLTAKEKVCVREGQACELATCPLARGYYDRRRGAMRSALRHEEMDRLLLERIGQQEQVCPFELALDLSSWVDAVICDYNYVFDPRVYLRRHFAEERREYVFLIDEAHNLVDRAREMFSAELEGGQIQAVRRLVRGAAPKCARALSKLLAALRQLVRGDAPAAEAPANDEEQPPLDLFSTPPKASRSLAVPEFNHESAPDPVESGPLRVLAECPEYLLRAAQQALDEAEAWLVQNQAAVFREELLELFFRLYAFVRTAERYDERFATLMEGPAPVRVKLFCIDPSLLLAEALARGCAAVLFSATLTPLEYYRDLLGGQPTDPVLQLASPFPPENLAVLLEDRLETHFRARAGTLPGVVRAIHDAVRVKKGNYLVYLPSYQYLRAVQEAFEHAHPDVRTLGQRPGMTDGERAAFLESFASDHPETLVGFAVLGGVFGEGIDLVGERLIGAVVVGVGLPQLSPERTLIREYFQRKTGAGFEYACVFPGMNRVLQATGRVIRSETDRGMVLLIDRRFRQRRYRDLFPGWWQLCGLGNGRELAGCLREFWEPTDGR